MLGDVAPTTTRTETCPAETSYEAPSTAAGSSKQTPSLGITRGKLYMLRCMVCVAEVLTAKYVQRPSIIKYVVYDKK
jgi:hypothetical protein